MEGSNVGEEGEVGGGFGFVGVSFVVLWFLRKVMAEPEELLYGVFVFFG